MKHQLELNIPIAFVDLETTGTNTELDSITEVGIVILHTNGDIQEWSTLVRPKQLITPFVEKLTGITNQMVAEAPYFSEVANEVIEILEGSLFVAHNVGFDYPILKKHLDEVGFELKCPRLCTVKSSRKLLKGFHSYGLGNLCKSLGISLENAHRALDDARASCEVFLKMVERHSLDDVLDLAINLWNPQKLPQGLTLKQALSLPDEAGLIKAYEAGVLQWVKATKSISTELFQLCQGGGPKYLQKQFQQFDDFEFTLTGSQEIAKLLEIDEFVFSKPTLNRNKIKIVSPQLKSIRDQILLSHGRTKEEASFLLVENEAIQGYGYFYKEERLSQWSEFEERLIPFKSETSFRADLEKWIQYRKFRNIPKK